MQNIKHVILDIGGVLAGDDQAAPLKFFKNKRANITRIKKTLDKIEPLTHIGKIPFSEYVRIFNKEMNTSYSVEEYQKLMRKTEKFNLPLIQFCRAHRKRFKVSILSDNHRSNVRYYNKHIKLKRWTYKQVYSCYCGVSKPNPAMYKLLLRKIKAKPSECIFVDNHTENIAMAEKLGMTGIVFKGNKNLFTKLNEVMA